MKLTYYIRNKRTTSIRTRIEMTLPNDIVIEKIKDQLAVPPDCDMKDDFEFHNICIEQS